MPITAQLLGHTLISHYFSFTCSMALLSMPKIGSWKLDDLVKDPTEKEFQDFLESITTKVAQLERRRGEPNNSISAIEFENFLHYVLF